MSYEKQLSMSGLSAFQVIQISQLVNDDMRSNVHVRRVAIIIDVAQKLATTTQKEFCQHKELVCLLVESYVHDDDE